MKGYDYWLTKDLDDHAPDPWDEEPEPCEWCGKKGKCRCEQEIDDYEWDR